MKTSRSTTSAIIARRSSGATILAWAIARSPAVAYQSDRKTLKYLDPEILASAFMHCGERKVDKSGCISFEGIKYEVGLTFICCKVDVIFDPADISELTIEYEGHQPFKARQLVIG